MLYLFTRSLARRLPLLLTMFILSLFVACSSQASSSNTAGQSANSPQATQASTQPANTTAFTITSPDFHDGGPLPLRVAGCGGGSNVAPTLTWTNTPSGTKSLALLMSDYDAPVAGGIRHWVVYNIPADAHQLQGNQPFTEGANSRGSQAYMGPCPPITNGPHHYLFLLYAFDVANIGNAGLHYDDVIKAAQSHVRGATSIVGLFQRTQN